MRIASILRANTGWAGRLVGWVRTVRVHKTHSFIDIDDGSGSIQVLSNHNVEGLLTGASVSVDGVLVEGPRQREIHAEKIELIGGSDGV